MSLNNEDLAVNMFPVFSHIINRICTPTWKLNHGTMDKHNIILIYEGSAVFGCNGKEYTGTKGSIIYYKPGDTRWAYTFKENPMKCIAIDFAYTCPIYSNNTWEISDMELPFKTLEQINDPYLFSRILNLFNECAKFWLSDRSNTIIRCRGCFIEVMNLLLFWKSDKGIQYDKIRKIEKVIRFLVDNYDKPLTLDELSNLVNISTSYLSSIFKEVTGTSPIKYLLNIRITKAEELIDDGYSITETSQLVGFNDVFYFSKCFKNKIGVSPTEYKNRNEF